MVHVLSLLSVAGIISSAAAVQKRAETEFPIYAYGVDIGGLKLWYDNGSAYVGPASTDQAASNVTFYSSTSTIDDGSTLSIVSSSDDSIVGELLAIESSSNSPVSFVSKTATSSKTTQGFTFAGTLLFWKSSTGSLESSFYAVPGSIQGQYQIYWMSDTTTAAGVPLALKKTAPAAGAITKEE